MMPAFTDAVPYSMSRIVRGNTISTSVSSPLIDKRRSVLPKLKGKGCDKLVHHIQDESRTLGLTLFIFTLVCITPTTNNLCLKKYIKN